MLLVACLAVAEDKRPSSVEPDTPAAMTGSQALDPDPDRDPDREADAEPDDSFASRFSFRGFGTLGLVYSNEDEADFVGILYQPNGAGHNRPVDFGVDSRLGAQLDVRITDALSGVVQVVSQHNYDNTYWPDLEWADLKYQITPDFSVRIGRTAVGLLLVADSRLVGFSYPWVRPPLEVYGMAPITNRDGIDASYRFHVRGFTNTLHAGYGMTREEFPPDSDGGRLDAMHALEISNTIERGPLSVRLGYSYARLDIRTGLDDLFDAFGDFGEAIAGIPGFEQASADALDIPDRYEVDDSPVSIFTIGGTYAPGNWLLMAELARFQGSGFLQDSTAWYVTGGYRIGAFTPYLTYAKLRADHRFEEGISTVGLPPPVAEGAGALNQALDSVLTGLDASQTTMAIGLRWDFRRNAALKLQYEHVDLRSGSNGRLGNVQSDFEPGGRLDVISLAIDFLF